MNLNSDDGQQRFDLIPEFGSEHTHISLHMSHVSNHTTTGEQSNKPDKWSAVLPSDNTDGSTSTAEPRPDRPCAAVRCYR